MEEHEIIPSPHMFGDPLEMYKERPFKMLRLRFGQPPSRKTSSAHPSSKPAWERKHARVSTRMRREICIYKQDHPNATHEAIARLFMVGRTTVGRALKDKDRWLSPGTVVSDKYHRLCFRRFGDLESNLRRWANGRFREKKLIKNKDIMTEAKGIRERSDSTVKGVFKASKTWLRNFKRHQGIAKGIIFANAEMYEWSAAFGFASTDPQAVSNIFADIGDKLPESLDVLREESLDVFREESSAIFQDATYTPPDISSLFPEAAGRRIVDLAELSAMIPRTPTPEPEPSTVTERSPGRIVHSIVDLAVLATAISRTPTPVPLAESPAVAAHPVLDINAFAVTTPRALSPADHATSSPLPTNGSKIAASHSSVDQRAPDSAISRFPSPTQTGPAIHPASGLQTLAMAASLVQSSPLSHFEDLHPASQEARNPYSSLEPLFSASAPESHARFERRRTESSPIPDVLAGRPEGRVLDPLVDAREALRYLEQVMTFISTGEVNLLPDHRDHLSVVRQVLASEAEKATTN